MSKRTLTMPSTLERDVLVVHCALLARRELDRREMEPSAVNINSLIEQYGHAWDLGFPEIQNAMNRTLADLLHF